MNKVVLIGNLTKEVEFSTTNNGKSVARLNLAVQRRFANAEGNREADFFNIVVWNTLADNCKKWLTKGSKIAVYGSMQTRQYEGKEGKKYITEIIAEEVEFVGIKKEKNEEVKLEPAKDEQIPF